MHKQTQAPKQAPQQRAKKRAKRAPKTAPLPKKGEALRLDVAPELAPGRRYGRKTLEFVRASPAPELPDEDHAGTANRAQYDRDEIDQA